MTHPKKKRLTITASEQGIETAERALIRLGFGTKNNFAQSSAVCLSSITKFFSFKSLQLDIFQQICIELKLNWKDIAGLTEEQEQIKGDDSRNLETQEEVESVQKCSRSITVINESTQTVKIKIILEGDFNSVDNLKIFELILQQYSGHTIKITEIQEGSIKLTIEGSQEDINRLIEQIQSGKLAEVNGFPIKNIEILSEGLDVLNNEESVNKKWDLIKEIVSQPTQNRNLSGLDLSDANLTGANLIGANLIGANLRGADLRGANLTGSDFTGADLIGADLIGADLIGANFRGADLRGADLRGGYLIRADLRGADLSRANLSGANLRQANLSGANLRGADLSGAYLIRAYLIRADLRGVDLRQANLDNTQVVKAKFSNSNLGMTEELKQDLINRGAIFEDSLEDPLSSLVKK